MEFIFEFILEGIIEVVGNLRIHPLLKVTIGITSMVVFIVFFIWLMIKHGVWQ